MYKLYNHVIGLQYSRIPNEEKKYLYKNYAKIDSQARRLSILNRHLSVPEIRNELNFNIRARTVQRRLCENSFYGRRPPK